MIAAARRLLSHIVPTHFRDPVGLAKRLVKTGDPAAHFAMRSAAAGLATTPLDLLLRPFENRLLRNAPRRKHPIVFVCGAPRSGTTVVAQTLINHLPVAYFDNLTSVFPRSPLTATRLLRRKRREATSIEYHSYYGKSTKWGGPNDALYLWDRWLGDDRAAIPTKFSERTARDMRRFFDAAEAVHGRALLNKCNNLNTFAHLVAEVLPEARFVCTTRDRRYLAQSLFKARTDIHGDPNVPYGLAEREAAGGAVDVYDDVCRQVLFHERTIERQRAMIGPKQFRIVPYEKFCAEPKRLVDLLRRDVFDLPPSDEHIPPFEPANYRKIDAGDFDRLASRFDELIGEETSTGDAVVAMAERGSAS